MNRNLKEFINHFKISIQDKEFIIIDDYDSIYY